jgi:hypothetical protein
MNEKCLNKECPNTRIFINKMRGYDKFCSKDCKMKHKGTKECKICGSNELRLGHHVNKYHTEISLEDYYNIYIKGNINKCVNAECNNNTKFINLDKGYNLACSISCSKIHEMNKEEQKDRVRIQLKEQRNKGNFKGDSTETKIKASKMAFKSRYSKFNKTKSFIYICEFSESIKIGITTVPHRRPKELKPLKYIIYEGTLDEITNLEESIKLKFNPIKGDEYFELNNKDKVYEMIPKELIVYSTSH